MHTIIPRMDGNFYFPSILCQAEPRAQHSPGYFVLLISGLVRLMRVVRDDTCD